MARGAKKHADTGRTKKIFRARREGRSSKEDGESQQRNKNFPRTVPLARTRFSGILSVADTRHSHSYHTWNPSALGRFFRFFGRHLHDDLHEEKVAGGDLATTQQTLVAGGSLDKIGAVKRVGGVSNLFRRRHRLGFRNQVSSRGRRTRFHECRSMGLQGGETERLPY